MVTLNVKELLKQKGKSKYWLFNSLNNFSPISYTNFNNMIENKTRSIKYENIDRLCKILDCGIDELFDKKD